MIAKILAKGGVSDIVGYVMREFHDKEKYTADTWRLIDSDGVFGDDYTLFAKRADNVIKTAIYPD